MVNQNTIEIQEFWDNFCSSLPKHEKNIYLNHKFDAWSFGDSPSMADDLLSYVLSGEKIATSGMLKDYEIEGEPIPKVGEMSIVLNGKNQPICVIETTKIIVQPYNEVDERFALAEGEGFKSLQDWRNAHWFFFSRRCKSLGIEVTETMTIVCEEFKVIYKK